MAKIGDEYLSYDAAGDTAATRRLVMVCMRRAETAHNMKLGPIQFGLIRQNGKSMFGGSARVVEVFD